jgi:hypothetical protein
VQVAACFQAMVGQSLYIILLSLAAIVMFIFLLRSLPVDFRIRMDELLLKQVGCLFYTVGKA